MHELAVNQIFGTSDLSLELLRLNEVLHKWTGHVAPRLQQPFCSGQRSECVICSIARCPRQHIYTRTLLGMHRIKVSCVDEDVPHRTSWWTKKRRGNLP